MRNTYRPLLGNATSHYVSTGPRYDTYVTHPLRNVSNSSVFNGVMPYVNEVCCRALLLCDMILIVQQTSHFKLTFILQVQAVAGIAIFQVPMYFMQPSIRITDATGAPYSDNTSRTDLITECCPLVWEAQTTTNEKTLSEQFHTYRKFAHPFFRKQSR